MVNLIIGMMTIEDTTDIQQRTRQGYSFLRTDAIPIVEWKMMKSGNIRSMSLAC